MDVCSSLIVIENLCGVITKDNTLMTDDNAAAAPMLARVSRRLLAETIICSSETLCPGQRRRGLTGECQERPCPIKEHSCSSVNAHFRHWLSEKADKLHSEVSDFFLFFFSSAALSLILRHSSSHLSPSPRVSLFQMECGMCGAYFNEL